jgi:spermidine synthase
LTNALGRHILVEFFDCDAAILNDSVLIENAMLEAAQAAHATILNSNFHHFSPFGVSGVVVIQESHLAIHTWPEYAYTAVDIFTCGHTINPWIAYHYLKSAFKAANGSALELNRGQIDLLKPHNTHFLENANPANSLQLPTEQVTQRDNWFIDTFENIGLTVRYKKNLFRKQSDFQLVQVFDTYDFGKMLTIDTMVMCTERDEFTYHEMITHPVMLIHPNPKNILVIGGGDGGTVRELFKHQSVETVTMVEIDKTVVDASRLYLPTLSAELDNPKLNLIIADGIAFVKNAPAHSFDVIIVDGSDPVGPAQGLFTKSFFQDIYKCLRPDGLLALQSESPYSNSQAFIDLNRCFRSIFGQNHVFPYLAFIPTYPTGMWSFHIVAKDKTQPNENFDYQLAQQFAKQKQLRYYNQDIHRAAFVLPTFVQQMLL